MSIKRNLRRISVVLRYGRVHLEYLMPLGWAALSESDDVRRELMGMPGRPHLPYVQQDQLDMFDLGAPIPDWDELRVAEVLMIQRRARRLLGTGE